MSGERFAGPVDGMQGSGGVASVGVHLGLHCGQPRRDRAARLGSEVIAGAVQVVQCGGEPVFSGGDERAPRSHFAIMSAFTPTRSLRRTHARWAQIS